MDVPKEPIMEKNRLEAFSDGVLAIVITIMVLELKQPVGDSLDDLLALEHVIVSYLLSFLFIAIYWVNHHLIFHQIETVNVKILWCNIIWLLVMSFIPFTTAWVGTYPDSWVPVTLYFLNMFLACITVHILIYFVMTGSCKAKFHLGLRNYVSFIAYGGAAFFGGFCPIVAFIIVAIVSIWWIFPEKY